MVFLHPVGGNAGRVFLLGAPVTAMRDASPAEHESLGKALDSLRDEGVLANSEPACEVGSFRPGRGLVQRHRFRGFSYSGSSIFV
ncbi:hypothetical protein EGT07_10700 [Herbaspirillum sp. HC18]|nr:hypothetical protein EGT07_10700 [Herbaspirillum sp. HC18]